MVTNIRAILRHLPALIVLALTALPARGQSVIFDMDTVVHKPGEITDKDKHRIPAGTAELVDGKFNKAVKFSFVEGASGGFMSARVHATPEWDKSAGFSFWVKGDGSDAWGGIEIIDRDDFGLRYAYCFPIDSTEWQKITVPWADLVPELKAPLIDPANGYAPSHFGNFWFGKWYYWRDYPAHSYTIDQVMLEPKIDATPTTAPLTIAPSATGLDRVRAKLRDHKPITLVTMGDSLSDKHHWSNREILWSELLAKELKTKYASEVTLINPAIGGTTLSQNIITMPRWSKQAPTPDLVAVWFGGNDWETGVRGPRFAEYLRLAVDHIRRQTHGSADILLMTPAPSFAHWETMAELEQAVRDVAKEKQTGLVDMAAEFHKAGSADEAMKREYWAWDKVHLGGKGHELVKNAAIGVISEQKD